MFCRIKKCTLIVVAVVAIATCLMLIWFGVLGLIKKFIPGDPQNIFEEIYNTQTRYGNRMPNRFYLDKESLKLMGKWFEYDGSVFCRSHYSGYENMNVVIECYKSPKKQLVIYCYERNEQGSVLISSVVYYIETKTLTSEYTDCSFLYEIVLPAWFDGMEERSDFTIDDLGKFTDET